MTVPYRTPNELRRAGFAALNEALGPIDAIRFLRQFDRGTGDYTAERAALLGSPKVGDLLRDLRDKN